MVADAALDAQAEGADLARLGAVGLAPAAGMAVAPVGRDAERRAGLDDRRLQGADEGPAGAARGRASAMIG